MAYAIISLGGKQYRVREGERLLVDRVGEEEGATIEPRVLLVGGDGDTKLGDGGVTVTALVVGHVLGEKIRIGKYRRRTGYKRHAGHRSRLTQIEIQAIGGKQAQRKAAEKPKPKPAPKAEEKAPPAEKPAAAAKPKVKADAAPKGLPKGYADLTVADVTEAAKSWNRPMLEAALAYEREHGKRKGAISALENAISKKDD